MIGVSPDTLSAYENGKSLPSIETIIKISEVVGTSVDEVMLLNYYVIINSSMFDDEDYSILTFRERNNNKSKEYYSAAENMLRDLSSERYQSRKENVAFLRHSTGHHPGGSEIDASIIYADYYYIEALLRLKKSGI
jgi:transcriptional regulator with XRE-family HTH domain